MPVGAVAPVVPALVELYRFPPLDLVCPMEIVAPAAQAVMPKVTVVADV